MSDAAQSSSRKSLIATSAVSVVLWVDQSPGINWVVDIDGASTWLFLLAAHSYFFIMYAANEGLHEFTKECLVLFHIGTYEHAFRYRLQRWLNRPFVTLLAVAAFGVIIYHLIWAGATATKAIDVACAARVARLAPQRADQSPALTYRTSCHQKEVVRSARATGKSAVLSC